MQSSFILSIDIGTSAVKTVLFDVHANQIGLARRSYPLIIPRSGWNEQDPDVVLQSTVEAIAEVLHQRETKSLIGIVLSCQMASVLAVDGKGKPVSRILTWSDTRSSEVSEALKRDLRAKQVYQTTGCPLEAIYPLSKIRWMIENNQTLPDTRFISVKDYILFHLTGQFITDWSMGSCTGLMDIWNHTWSIEALSMAGIAENNLPRLVSTRYVINLEDTAFLRKTGIPAGTPLVMGAGDAPLSSLGVGALASDILVVNVGTSTAARKMVKKPIPDDRQQLWTYILDETHWVTGGMSSSGGMIYDWFKNQFIMNQTQDAFIALEKQASDTPPCADGLIFIPYLAGEQCPAWQSSTRGGFQGLDILHHRGHMTRAVLEGITFSIYRIIETIQSVHTTPIKEIRVTGGLAASSLWKQIAADVFGLPLIIANSNEGSARGGAFLALNVLGYLSSFDKVDQYSITDSTVQPKKGNHERYMAQYQKFLAYLDGNRKIGAL